MLGHGAEQVLIDGAIDRRAASSPAVTDGLVMSTGAVLGSELAEVVSRTRDAVEVARLPELADPQLRRLVERTRGGGASREAGAASLLVREDYQALELAPRFVLTSEAEQIAGALDANAPARWLIVPGALPEAFIQGLVRARRGRGGELVLVVADSTRVFLAERGPEYYRRQGVGIETLDSTALEAITVNPVAPQSHSFDSVQLRSALEQTIDDVPIFDVLHSDYLSIERAASRL
jgi:hypothetical protein